ncbi:MAG: PhzF family phenazine biosynthesis protein [Ignavibacteria bacterium]|jgi:PhzF family phenazine biosynthesis protein
MKLKMYFVDAFAEEPFTGNPAGVTILKQWLPDDVMQNIAAENNLSETAFVVQENDRFYIRWFTPQVEVDLCGHATLASGFVLFNELKFEKKTIIFESKSGILKVTANGDNIALDFPALDLKEITIPENSVEALGIKPVEAYSSIDDYFFVYDSQSVIEKITPDNQELMKYDCRGIIVTAPGNNVDFVSRFFAPKVGIPEDPVTGSAHTKLIPYWSKKLGKQKFTAKQLSKRGGKLYCSNNGDRVEIAGKAILYLSGEINI